MNNKIAPLLNKYLSMKCINTEITDEEDLLLTFGTNMEENQTSKYCISFNWYWNLANDIKIVASSRIRYKSYLPKMKARIQVLHNKILLDFKYNEHTNDLFLYFEDNLVLKSFNDIGPQHEDTNLPKLIIFGIYSPEYNINCLANGEILNENF